MSAGPVLARGTLAGDFRIERVLRRIAGAVVYEAMQVSLERRVSLTVMDPPPTGDQQFAERFGRECRLLAGLEHPNIATVIAAGRVEQGLFVATRLVAGSSLGEREVADRGRALELLAHVAAALDAAHCAGLAHRAIEPSRVIVCDGRAYLTDFALGRTGGGIAEDRVSFAAMLQELLGTSSTSDVEACDAVSLVAEAAAAYAPESPIQAQPNRRLRAPAARRKRRSVLIAAALVTGIVATVTIGAGGFADQSLDAQAPSLPPGARVLGSNLGTGSLRTLDCGGDTPSSTSPSCTVMQARLPGRRVAAEHDGVVVGWAVRGARGDLALQVLRREARGYTDVTRTAFVRVPDGGLHRFGSDLPIRRGEHVAVELRPGSGIGVRDGPAGTSTERWIARLGGGPRPPSRMPGRPFEHELLLAAAYLPGRDRQTPAQLVGARAARAPSGRTLASAEQELPGGAVRELRAVKLEDRLVLDLLAGDRRLSRLEVPDADPAGRLLALVKEDRTAPDDTEQILRWQNPGATEPLVHSYRIGRARLALID